MRPPSMLKWLVHHRRFIIFLGVAGLHLGALLSVRIALPSAPQWKDQEYHVLKLVDVEEYQSPPRARVLAKGEQPRAAEGVEVRETPVVDGPVFEAPVVEAVVMEAPIPEAPVVEPSVTEAPVVETPVVESPIIGAPVMGAPVVQAPPQGEGEQEFVPQHRVSEIPVIPTQEILARIHYPPIALKRRIQGVVLLELYIDQWGRIRRIEVLKDPGHGFAQAAVAALDGVLCRPARVNGVPVGVRFRYPVRFALR